MTLLPLLLLSSASLVFSFPVIGNPEAYIGPFSHDIERLNEILTPAMQIDPHQFYRDMTSFSIFPTFIIGTEYERGENMLEKKIQKGLERALIMDDHPRVESLFKEFSDRVKITKLLKRQAQNFLEKASYEGNLNAIDTLLTKTTGLVDDSAFRSQALNFAISRGNIVVVRKLIEGGKYDTAAFQGAAEMAAVMGKTASLQIIFDMGHLDPGFNDSYLLKIAIFNGRRNIMKQLLRTGKVNPAADNNFAAILATQKGSILMVLSLLGTGKVDPEAVKELLHSRVAKNIVDWYAWWSGFKRPLTNPVATTAAAATSHE
jgi:hypothetical protein